MKTNKSFCLTHRFHYIDKCPFCEQDRINSYSKKYATKKPVLSNNNNDNDNTVTDDMLTALVNHFKN